MNEINIQNTEEQITDLPLQIQSKNKEEKAKKNELLMKMRMSSKSSEEIDNNSNKGKINENNCKENWFFFKEIKKKLDFLIQDPNPPSEPEPLKIEQKFENEIMPEEIEQEEFKKPNEELIPIERSYQAKKKSPEEIYQKLERLEKKINFKKNTFENLKREFDHFNYILLQNKS